MALDKELAERRAYREELRNQYSALQEQLNTARDAVNAVDLSDAEKAERQAVYNDLWKQSQTLKAGIDKLWNDQDAARRDYNSRVDKHNSELGDNKKLQ